MDENERPRPMAASADPAAPAPQRIITLESDWNGHVAGKVMPADADVLAKMDADGAKYRDATDFEKSVGLNFIPAKE